MDIDNFISVCLDHRRRNLHKESSQNDEIRLTCLDSLQKRLIERIACFIRLRSHNKCRDTVVFRALNRIGALIVADNRHNFCVRDLAVINRIQDCLQICTAARHHYNDS